MPVDVEDLAQETYLRLLRRPDLSEVRNPQAYLLGVARHVVMEWRDDQPAPDSLVALDDELLLDENLPEFELEASHSRERLESVLAAVSPTMRAVLILKLRDERSSRQIADDLGLTPRQVKRHLERGYERLHQVLEK